MEFFLKHWQSIIIILVLVIGVIVLSSYIIGAMNKPPLPNPYGP
jgi:hypothetical protein